MPSDQPLPLPHYPPRPPLAEGKLYLAPFKQQGLPQNAAKLLLHHRQSIKYLCKAIFDVNRYSLDNWPSSPISVAGRLASLKRLLFILSCASQQLVELAIKCELHKCFYDNADRGLLLPSTHFQNHVVSDKQPVIYVLVHCGPKGETLSRRQLLTIINTMRTYARTYSIQLTAQIDAVNPRYRGHD